jgi:glycine/D-amino acid oxidase-like deaminating enzyme
VASAPASAASDETVLIRLAMTGTIARTMDEHVVIVGAGPAALAAAWAIRQAGRDPLVVDQADAVSSSCCSPMRPRVDVLAMNSSSLSGGIGSVISLRKYPGVTALTRIPRRGRCWPR